MRSPESTADPLERLMQSVLAGPKYRRLCPEVVRRIGAAELARRRSWKEAEKETRSRLHQIAGAYLETTPPYTKWLEALRAAPDAESYRSELRRMMLCHTSTRERLPELEKFYERTLSPIQPVHSVIDVACGLNTLALPWMGLADGAAYSGFDLYRDMADFACEAMRCSPFAPNHDVRVDPRDLAPAPPDDIADVALVLKFLPLLDSASSVGMLAWLRQLRTRFALVSFPTRTLGGRNVGMIATFDGRLRDVIDNAGWRAERFDFSNELCYLVELQSE